MQAIGHAKALCGFILGAQVNKKAKTPADYTETEKKILVFNKDPLDWMYTRLAALPR